MKKILPLIIILLLAIAGIFYLVRTPISPLSIEDQDKLTVMTSILPLQSLVEEIGGEFVQAQALVPAGASVHTYEPTPDQLRTTAQADAFVQVGTDIEFEVLWLDKLIGTNQQLQVIDASTGIELIEFKDSLHKDHDEHGDEDHHDDHGDDEHDDEDKDGHGHSHEGDDPHIWLSAKNLQIMTGTIADALATIDPDNAEFYQAQKAQVLERLEQLDASLANSLANSNKELIVYHDAWGYFANDYGLNLITIEENEKEPTAKRLQDVITLAKENAVSVIFASPEFNTQSAETIAREVGAEVVLISPLPANIFTALQDIADAFASAS